MMTINDTQYDNATLWLNILAAKNRDYAAMLLPVTLFIVLVMITGLVGNFLIIFVCIYRTHKTSSSNLILSLAMLDILSCIINHPFVLYKLLNHFEQGTPLMCKLCEYCVHASFTISVFLLLAIAVDRYVAVCRPHRYFRLCRFMKRILVSSFMSGLIITLPIWAFFETIPVLIDDEKMVQLGSTCVYTGNIKLAPLINMFGAVTTTGFAVVCVSITVMYSRICCVILRQRRVVAANNRCQTVSDSVDMANINPMTLGSSSTPGRSSSRQAFLHPDSSRRADQKTTRPIVTPEMANSPTNGLYSNPNKIIPERKKKQTVPSSRRSSAAGMLFAVTLLFFISWIPYWVRKFITIVSSDVKKNETDDVLNSMIIHLPYLNNSANALIYYLANKRFRQDCCDVLERKCCRRCCLGAEVL